MTVAAVIVVPDPAVALSETEGLATVRRVVQSAWAGGAIPVQVVAAAGADADSIRVALDGLPASLLLPDLPPGSQWFGAGIAAARAAVTETSAAILWPVRYGWVDPETVTSLLEAHGVAPRSLIRASFHGRPGFPILVPVELGARFGDETTLHAYELVESLAAEGTPLRLLELGDPGIVSDVATPRSELPPYQGPPEPAAQPPEWNESLARQAQDRESDT